MMPKAVKVSDASWHLSVILSETLKDLSAENFVDMHIPAHTSVCGETKVSLRLSCASISVFL